MLPEVTPLTKKRDKFRMRRSKRLAARNCTKFSETEGSSQDEDLGDEVLDLEDLVSKAYDFITTKISSQSPLRDGDDDKACTKKTEATSEAEEHDEEFITLPTEFKRTLKDPTELSSELQACIDTKDLYFKFDASSLKPVRLNRSFSEVASGDSELMKRSVITSDFEKRSSIPPMHISQHALKKQRKNCREESAGPKWFNLPATKITPEIERDMKLLKMRNVLDSKRHYKKNDSSSLPKYFQIGTVTEAAADFYSSRIPKRQRKSNLIDELLADAKFRRYNKKKYLEIQAAKQSGRKGFYKKKMNKRRPTWSRT